jgi:hypothetical protein
VATTRDDDAAQVGNSGDDMAITAFPALVPRLQSVSYLLTVKIRQPSHEFTFGVDMSFIPYPLVLTPVV